MKNSTVVFFTIKDYDNLGVGYMAALLTDAGFDARVIDLNLRRKEILKIVKKLDPVLIGLSVIFHNHIDQFVELTRFLRKKGINCHITAGGHYATLRQKELFNLIPLLDSIIRSEGEYPMLELARCIRSGNDWKKLRSIVFKENFRIISNPLWPLEKDLDQFPYPVRSNLTEYVPGKKFTTILAGRGCVHNCSFCNTREFYSQLPGPVKRIRRPELVVDEMRFLYTEKKCSVFLFQDDDFPVKSKKVPDWTARFCSELEKAGISRRAIWKISCRPDEIEAETFALMKRNGLFLVFLGIEDGSDDGLKLLNKQMTVNKCLNGINILKKLEIGFDFGFMLFQPGTTYRSLNENLDFLKQVCGDGYSPVTFLRLIPMYETRVEKELMQEGRLRSVNGMLNYEFQEGSMNDYYDFITGCFMKWLRYPDGVENISRWARNYILVFMFYCDIKSEETKYINKIRRLISESNCFLIDTLKELSLIFESDQFINERSLLEGYHQRIKSKHRFFRDKIINNMAQLISCIEKN